VKRTTVATAAELRDLAERALAELDALEEEGPAWHLSPAQIDRSYWRRRAAVEALRLCGAAAAVLGEPSLAPLLARALDAVDGRKDHRGGDLGVIADGLERALAGGAPANVVADLADHHDARIRRALAGGLRPVGAPERALLEQLARDPDAEVRKPARETLAALGEVPWWTGKWSRDPLAALAPDEAERHRAAIERIAEILDMRRYTAAQHDEELAALAATLPDALAVDLAETALSARCAEDTKLPALGAVMAAREGGLAALFRLCERWARLPYFRAGAEHFRMVAGMPEGRRLDACLALARRALELTDGPRGGDDDSARVMAALAGHGFPPDADPTPLVDLLVPRPARAWRDMIAYELLAAVRERPSLPAPLEERMFEAWAAGLPGGWGQLIGAISARIDRAPLATRRRLAERAAGAADERTACWALSLLALEAHDPDRDPPRDEVVRRYWEDHDRRRLLLGHHGDAHLLVPRLREALRRGALDFPTAVATIRAMGRLWGGVVRFVFAEGVRPPPAEDELRDAQQKYGGCFGPSDPRGPIGEADWTALRAARASHFTWDDHAFLMALAALPEGPWHPDDRAVLDRAVAYAEASDRGLLDTCAYAVRSKMSTADDLPLLARLRSLALEPDDRDTIDCQIRGAREDLGLPPPPDEEEGADAAGESAPAREWMDDLEGA